MANIKKNLINEIVNGYKKHDVLIDKYYIDYLKGLSDWEIEQEKGNLKLIEENYIYITEINKDIIRVFKHGENDYQLNIQENIFDDDDGYTMRGNLDFLFEDCKQHHAEFTKEERERITEKAKNLKII